MLRVELTRVDRVLHPLGIALVLLKGAAYVAQQTPIAAGRLPNDVDVMVDREQLFAAEAALLGAGWRYDDTLDAYDHHYYRRWSHELPPLRYEGFVLELDLHHTILPPTARVSVRAEALMADRVPIAGTRAFALSPVDQLLHIAAHVFLDSDCSSRLRDLVDFDALYAWHAARDEGFAARLADRAQQLQFARPLAYALSFADAWLPAAGVTRERRMSALAAVARVAAPRRWVLAAAGRTLPPHHPDSVPSAGERWSQRLLALRYGWWRMPLGLALYHATMKGLRRMSRGA